LDYDVSVPELVDLVVVIPTIPNSQNSEFTIDHGSRDGCAVHLETLLTLAVLPLVQRYYRQVFFSGGATARTPFASVNDRRNLLVFCRELPVPLAVVPPELPPASPLVRKPYVSLFGVTGCIGGSSAGTTARGPQRLYRQEMAVVPAARDEELF